LYPVVNHIAYLSIARVPSRTANSIHVMRMCHALAKQGYSITLYAPLFSASEYEKLNRSVFDYYGVSENFTIKQFKWFPFKGRSTIYSTLVFLHVRYSRTDLVYARDLKSGVFCAKQGLPVVYEAHSPISIDNKLFGSLIASMNFRRLVVISDALRKIFENTYPQLSGKILVAHDAADIDECDITKDNQLSERLRIGYVGHLYRGRGIDLIIDLAERCPWADFEIVGGMESDIDHWKEHSEKRDNIHFHGHLPYNQAANIRQHCDILLAPFTRKLEVSGGGADTSGWMSPMKIFEYMAAGKAILCSDLPVLREVLEHEETALFCEAENVDEWQRALERLRDDKVLMKSIGQQARDKLEKYHTWYSRAATVIAGVIE